MELDKIFWFAIGFLLLSGGVLFAWKEDYVNFGNNYVKQRLILWQENPEIPYNERIYNGYYELTGNEKIAGNLSFFDYQMPYSEIESEQLEFGGCANVRKQDCSGKLFCDPNVLIIENFTFDGYGQNVYDNEGNIVAYQSETCYTGNAIVHSHPIIKDAGFLGGKKDSCYFSKADMQVLKYHQLSFWNPTGQTFSILVCGDKTIKIATTDGYGSYYGYRYKLGFPYNILQWIKGGFTNGIMD